MITTILFVILISRGFLLESFTAPSLLNSVYGYKLTDPEYKQYYDSSVALAGFNENLLINSCVLMETPTTMIIDSKGLEGTMFEGDIDLDPCNTIAQHVFVDGYGYTITDTDRW